jgi:hypothetical protein
MVKALHRAGIEVILDVVFNHTAEGDHRGPTLSFRGLDNAVYYVLESDRARYANYSGSGNTLTRIIHEAECTKASQTGTYVPATERNEPTRRPLRERRYHTTACLVS